MRVAAGAVFAALGSKPWAMSRYLNYSIRTEDAYVYWMRAFIFFHGGRYSGAQLRSSSSTAQPFMRSINNSLLGL